MKKTTKFVGILLAAAIVTGVTASVSDRYDDLNIAEARNASMLNSAATEKIKKYEPYIAQVDMLNSINGKKTEATKPATTTTVTSPTTVTTETTVYTTTVPVATEPPAPIIDITNLQVETISVSCLKITWDADDNREYNISIDTNADYQENIHFVEKASGVCYFTGLRENSEYTITVSPVLTEGENAEIVYSTVKGRTEAVDVIYEYPYEDGWTGCFAGERASGLTAMPSSGAIAGSYMDDITDTTIRRKANGDYCVAMGLFYGQVGDRFLIEMENGVQFTVQICDSKGWCDAGSGDGAGHYHWFGGEGVGKCIIEFIYDSDSNLPGCVRTSGSWGGYDWNGLNLGGNIASIKMINY